MTAASVTARIVRAAVATAMSLSWLLLAGAPATAAVTAATVTQPEAGAAVKRAEPLVVVVERTAPAPDEQIGVRTRLLYAGNEPPPPPEGEAGEEQQAEPAPEPKPVSKKVLELQLAKQEPTPGGDRLYFSGVIDPYDLAWLPRGGVASNGSYVLRYQVFGGVGDPQRPWQDFRFRIDAPPPATSAPVVGAQDAAAKRMAVAWQAVAVPDLSHFIVERRKDDGAWKVARAKVAPDTRRITDTVDAYGSYRYRIVSVRPAGDGSDKVRATTSLPSATFQLTAASAPAPRGQQAVSGGGGSSNGTSDGSGGSVPGVAPAPATGGFSSDTAPADDPAVAPPAGFDETYKGPLDFGVEHGEVTERVPVDVARGGAAEDSTLRVLSRSIDQERVLPPLAGGLILVVSAAHVMRYLNE